MSIYKEIGATQIAVTSVQSLLIVLNIAGNTLVCVIIVKNKDMRTSINYLLVNLAVADMTVAAFLAVRYIFIHTFTHPDGETGIVLCSLLTGGNVAWVAAGCSVFTLAAIATERYYTVMYPHKNKGKLSNRKLKVIISCSWIFGVTISLPMFLVRNFDKEGDACVLDWPEEWMDKAYSVAWFLFTSFIPVCLMIALYSRVVYTLWVKQRNPLRQQAVMKLRKRVTLMVITVSVIFGVTWLTDTINHVLYSFIPSYSFLTYAATSILLLLNSAINPIVYALVNQRFRRKVNKMMCRSCRPASCRMPPARELEAFEVSLVTVQAPQETGESPTE